MLTLAKSNQLETSKNKLMREALIMRMVYLAVDNQLSSCYAYDQIKILF